MLYNSKVRILLLKGCVFMKPIERTKSIVGIIGFSLLFLIGILFSFIPMKWGTKNFNSTLGAILTSNDVSNGIVATYKIKGNPTDSEIQKSVEYIGKLLAEEGYVGASVFKFGDDKLRIEISEPNVKDEIPTAKAFLSSLTGGHIDFSTASSFENISNEGVSTLSSTKHFKSINIQTYQSYVGVVISYKFSAEDKTNELDKAIYKTLYMYRNGEQFPSSSNYTLDGANSNTEKTTLWLKDYKSAKYYASILKISMIPILLDSDSVEIVDATASAPITYASPLLFLSVVTLALAIGLFIYLIVTRKLLGVISLFAFMFVVFLSMFALQIMPWVEISISGFVAIFFSIILIVLSSIIFFNRMSEEYKLGKSIETSTRCAYKRFWTPILMISILFVLTGIAIALIAQREFATIGSILAIGGISNILASLGLLPLFVSFSHTFVNENGKLFGFTREAQKNEDN